MKRLSVYLTLLVVLSLVIGSAVSCPAPEAPEPVVLRLTHALPPMDLQVIENTAMGERFNARAKGEYIIEVYPGEALVKMTEQFDAVRTGASEMASMPPSMQATYDIRFDADELPFAYRSFDAKLAAVEPMKEIYDNVLQNFNQKLVSLAGLPTYNTCSTKPIRTLEDWEGKLVMPLSPVCAEVVGALGGSTVWIPYPEQYGAMEKGVIEVAVGSIEGMLIFHMYEVARYLTYSEMFSGMGMITVNLDVWKAMPKHIQDVMLEECKEMERRMAEYYKKAEVDNIKKAEDLGMEVYVVPEAERERWREASRPIFDALIAQMGPDGQKVMDIIDKANRENP